MFLFSKFRNENKKKPIATFIAYATKRATALINYYNFGPLVFAFE